MDFVIGIDFDNTIVSYDSLLHRLAVEAGFIVPESPVNKTEVRDAVRRLPDGERRWQELQGAIYGHRIHEAEPTDGVIPFIRACRDRGARVVIVSHKTEFATVDPTRTSLRHAALGWLEEHHFFEADGGGMSPQDVYFGATRTEKITHIRNLACTHFIDDLVEVFSEPNFPQDVQSFLFAAGWRTAPLPGVVLCRTFGAAAESVLFHLDAWGAATEILGRLPSRVTPTDQGGNARIFRVDSHAAVKVYPRPGADPRDRMTAEYEALRFLGANDLPVPRLLGQSARYRATLMTWIDGAPIVAPNAQDMDQLLDFLAKLHARRLAPSAKTLGLASEACLAPSTIVEQIEVRLERFAREEAAPHAFLDGPFREVLKTCRGSAVSVPPLLRAQQTLSPSDFGFHNALRRADGGLAFLDFEYFGWDDPVKLTSDVLWHPGMRLSPALKRQFMAGASSLYGAEDPGFHARLQAVLPLYGLRWCIIVLNIFLPSYRRARGLVLSGRELVERQDAQLQKATGYLNAVKQGRSPLEFQAE